MACEPAILPHVITREARDICGATYTRPLLLQSKELLDYPVRSTDGADDHHSERRSTEATWLGREQEVHPFWWRIRQQTEELQAFKRSG